MNSIHKISIFALCLLVLLSSSSFIVGIHLCDGNVQEIGLNVNVDGCEKHKQVPPPCHKQIPPGCCDDATIVHDGHDLNASASQNHVTAADALEMESPWVAISEIIPSASFSGEAYHQYDSPLRSSDLTISLQVFLI